LCAPIEKRKTDKKQIIFDGLTGLSAPGKGLSTSDKRRISQGLANLLQASHKYRV